MDEFDVIDFVYDTIESAGCEVMIYKGKSEPTQAEHIVINHLALNEFEFINKLPVNINIFVPLHNGLQKRKRLKELKRKVRSSLDTINSEDGYCREIEVLWSIPIPDAKEGFDCVSIRLDIVVDN